MSDLLSIKYLPLVEARKFDRNAKKHDISAIADSIARYGFKDPPKWEPALNGGNGGIVEGNGRIEALSQLQEEGKEPPRGVAIADDGSWAIPIVFGVDSDSEVAARAYALDHNLLTMAGGEFTAADMSRMFEIDEYLKELNALSEEDELPISVDIDDLNLLLEQLEQNNGIIQSADSSSHDIDEVTPRCKKNEIWALGRHRLLCGDSTDKRNVEVLLDGAEIELLFTSPPYADMRTYQDGTDISLEKICSFIPAWADHVNYFAVNLGLKFEDSAVVPYWQKYIDIANSTGLKLLAWNVWDKQQAGSIAHAKNMFAITHEWIFVFGEKKKKLKRTIPNQMDKYAKKHGENFLSGTTTRVRQEDGSVKPFSSKAYTHHQLHSVIQCFPELGSVRKIHPAIYPVELPTQYFKAMTVSDSNIADPFCGSGTTIIAAEQMNSDRTVFGIELSEHYCEVAMQRWEKLTGKTAVKISG